MDGFIDGCFGPHPKQMCAAASHWIMPVRVRVSDIRLWKRRVRLIQTIKIPSITIETSVHTITVRAIISSIAAAHDNRHTSQCEWVWVSIGWGVWGVVGACVHGQAWADVSRSPFTASTSPVTASARPLSSSLILSFTNILTRTNLTYTWLALCELLRLC